MRQCSPVAVQALPHWKNPHLKPFNEYIQFRAAQYIRQEDNSVRTHAAVSVKSHVVYFLSRHVRDFRASCIDEGFVLAL